MKTFLVVPTCLAASPALAFKSSTRSSINSSVGGSTYSSSSSSSSTGGSYRRRHPPRRSQISIRQHDTSAILLLLLEAAETDGGKDNDSSTSSAIITPLASKAVAIEIIDSNNDGGDQRRLSAAPIEQADILVLTRNNSNNNSDDQRSTTIVASFGSDGSDSGGGGAATNTVNERLMSEIQASLNKEKYGSSSKTRQYFKEFRSQKTDLERQRSVDEARDLNGVNPLVCIGGAGFAWLCAGGLWWLTTFLGTLFALHPVDADSIYFVQRMASVFRNVAVGLSSLASGFFGVVGVGIFLLGVRVAYGVMMGELDPTPIKPLKSEEIVMPDILGLMMGKKPDRRGKRGM